MCPCFRGLSCLPDASLHSGFSLSPFLQGAVWINNRSKIVQSDYTTSNGVIHHVDTLLTPYRLQDKPAIKANTVSLSSKRAHDGLDLPDRRCDMLISLCPDELHRCRSLLWLHEVLQTRGGEQTRWRDHLNVHTSHGESHESGLSLSGRRVTASAQAAHPPAVHHVLAHGRGPRLAASREEELALQPRPPGPSDSHREGAYHTQLQGRRETQRHDAAASNSHLYLDAQIFVFVVLKEMTQ